MQRSVDHAVTSARAAAQKPSNAAQAALMQTIGGLAINRASLRFEDGGLTKRLFAFLAEKQKLSPAQLIMALKIAAAGEAPTYAPILGKPLANAILKAVDAYLSDPRSLIFTLAPASPVPAGVVLVAAQSQPEKLKPMLGLAVQAKDRPAMASEGSLIRSRRRWPIRPRRISSKRMHRRSSSSKPKDTP